MPTSNLGPDHRFPKRLTEIETVLTQMRQTPALENASNTQSDGTVGVFIGRNPDGTACMVFRQGPGSPVDGNGQHPTLLYVGQLVTGGMPDGAGVLAYRPDGTPIMVLGAGGFGFNDHAANLVLAPDENAGWGLAAPWIPLPTPQNTNIATWPSTTSTTWTHVAQCNCYLTHPKIRWNGYGFVTSGTAQFQLVIGGVPSPTVWTADASVNNGFVPIAEDYTLPAGSHWLAGYEIDVQAQVTSGTGTASVVTYGLYGRQS